ncbi:major facilitator superfamily MFS_1 [Nitrobacter hamburgensis X14]|uniref:Major facilitator superfamily MFS_1 n=1 Tax=Nitrobacter hamburgensis (strain DSM 10229 / NCIMB 13809 / X14) TaxID=323097 RepID=Q1QMJ2_NITHX|nr:MFS transporter [Nitrobacter hamburgensis]ABE62555.1 major facilitator superfamily MFS_1 [Nitrobacter hamburgensis X14]
MTSVTSVAAGKHKLPPLLNIIALATFAASLSTRAMDPVLPHVADDLSVTVATAAGLSAVTAFSFATVQPLIGAAADIFGKGRLMLVCLVLLGIANVAGALCTSYSALFVTRIFAGIASGGVFPVALGMASDLVPASQRQVAIGRTIAGTVSGNLLGASFSGVIGDLVGWRGVLVVLGVLVLAASIAVGSGFRRGNAIATSRPMKFTDLRHGYRQIFSNPNARVCYSAVFIEGCCVLGLFPYVAAFLFELGETRLSVAGIVIAGFAVGGLFYTMTVSRLLSLLGVRGMMISGAMLVAAQIVAVGFGPDWRIQMLSFIAMGWGFYMLHGCLQVFASELSEQARATALSLHSFFFYMGQTAGPIAYGVSLSWGGKFPTLAANAVVIMILGLVCARLLVGKAGSRAA